MQTCAAIELEASPRGGVPIRCFSSDKRLLPDAEAIDRLRLLAALPGLDHHVVVLPDVHYKPRNPTPTGTAMVTRDRIVPRAIDLGVNCGMRSMATTIPASEFTPDVLDRLFGLLLERIPLKRHETPLISVEDCEAMLVHGIQALLEPLGLPQDEVTRCENGGHMLSFLDPEQIRAAIPPKAIAKGIKALGTVGAGNHFLELQEIVEIGDASAAAQLDLRDGATVFMMHSDSRRLGKKIMEPVREEAEAMYRRDDNDDLWSVPVDSDMGRRLLGAMAAAMNAGFANRAAVTGILRQAIRDTFADQSLDLFLVYDCGHETIQPEEHHGSTVWVHRHGASRAVPPGVMTHDSILAQIGQPIPLAGCMGTDSFIGVASDGTANTFHSVAHGAGRVMEKVDAAEAYDEQQVQDEMSSSGIRLYRYEADNIAGQAPASFKDVNAVMNVMTEMDLMKMVARVRPRAVLKG